MIDVPRQEFEELVERSLRSLPSAFKRRIDNVAVLVEEWPRAEDLDTAGVPPGDTLLGLYQGVSYPRREPTSYHGALPDRLVLYRGPICEASAAPQDVERTVRETVIHEVGHYFGLTESEIRRAERARGSSDKAKVRRRSRDAR